MIVIGIDPHKRSHTAVAIDQHEQPIAQLTLLAGPTCAVNLLDWAAAWPHRRWAIEGARGLGYLLAQQLAAVGEQVVDVNAKLAARARLLDHGHGRKTDHADARSVALVALRAHRLPPVTGEDDVAGVLRLLADRRDELNQERRRVTNRLHRLLRDLLPGGAPTPLTAPTAALLLRRTTPVSDADQQRKALARELLADLRRLDRQLAANRARCQEVLKARPTRLIEIFGISAVLATKLIGHSGTVTRFAGPDHYASYTGTAPVDASSGPNTRQRVNRGGNRALNTAIHLVARTQISRPGPGRTYYDRKLAEGKTPTRPSAPSSVRSSSSSTGPCSPTTRPATPSPKPPPVDIQALSGHVARTGGARGAPAAGPTDQLEGTQPVRHRVRPPAASTPGSSQ